MKKFSVFLSVLLLILTLCTGCSGKTEEPDESAEPAATAIPLTPVTVGTYAAPNADILAQIRDSLAAEGRDLQIVICDDDASLYEALAGGDIDAGYCRNAAGLSCAALIHCEPFGIYANALSDLSSLADGATVLIPADEADEARALCLLAQAGLITLSGNVSPEPGGSVPVIADNGGFNIVAVPAETLPAQLDAADPGTVAVIKAGNALQAGLLSADALAFEDVAAAQTYADVITCRDGEERSEKITALCAALTADAVRQYIAETYSGAIVALF